MKTRLWDQSLLDIGPCLSCGFDGPDYVCGSYVSGSHGVISCDKCRSVSGASYRDAEGNSISFPVGGFKNNYSDAVGEPVTSKKAFSDILKKNGLRQNGGHFVNGRSMGEYRRPIKT